MNVPAALPKPLAPDAAATPSATFPLVEYALAATLDSGQAFRWRRQPDASWEGVIGSRWVRLRYEPEQLLAETAAPVADWRWLLDYLQLDADLAQIRATFPDDPPMRAALAHCRGLRLLRQEPWECLASFILSSTKQIVQIRQIVEALCIRFGQPLAVPPGHAPVHAFPTAARLAACSEAELRGCKMGFRAPYLRATAQRVHAGDVALATLGDRTCAAGRGELMELPGVGCKIADCVLLFAYGFPEAFPVDVWVRKGLQQLYFPRRRVSPQRLEQFAATHFGVHAGYAQQYLFHYMRTGPGETARPARAKKSRGNNLRSKP